MARRNKNPRQKLRASLGDSWDEANYSTDGDSTANHSEIELELSDSELQGQELNIGARPSGNREDSLSEPHSKDRMPTSVRSVNNDRTARMPKPTEPLPLSEQPGPSFMMPKLQDTLHSTNGSPSRRTQTRSQNVRNRTPHLRTSDRSSTSYNPASRAQPDSAPTERQQSSLVFIYENVLSPTLRYLAGVFGHTMGNLQPLLGLVATVLILVFGIQLAIGSARSSLTMALTPICLIPGSSYVIPFCATTSDDSRVDFEGLLHAQSGLEDILDAAKDTSTLPSIIKDSELAIRDLRGLVRHSRLPSRHQLGLEFDNFITTANDVSIDLSRFNSRIGATVDRVIATNTWTRAVLSGLSEQEASYGALDRVYSAITRPFAAPSLTLQERIFDQYALHVSKNAEEITKLIDAGVALHSVLQYLDGLLDTIYQIAINDDASITKNQEELLTQLWTIVGGNKSKLNTNNKKLMLLRNVSAYRKKALTHVSETLLKLREIQAELENLREGVEAPSVLGYRDELPISYHLDLIDRGVDRLRTARGESMRVEGETYRNLVGRGEERRELAAPVVTARVK